MKILEEIVVPQESVNDDNVIITEIPFKNGDYIHKGDIILEFETSKAITEIESKFDGYVIYFCKEGDAIKIGEVIAKIVDNYQEREIKANDKTQNENNNTNKDKYKTVFSLKALELINKYGLNKEDFEDRDFVNEQDVYLFLNPSNDKTDNNIISSTSLPIEDKLIIDKNNDNIYIEKLPIQKLREIEYLSVVQKYGLVSSVSVSVDVENVINFVNTHLSLLKGSFLPIIIYELSRLLKKFSKLNAFYENKYINYYKDINIGIAIDMEKGLKVLKINKTDTLSMLNIEEEILNISKKYLDRKSTRLNSSHTDISRMPSSA